MTNITLNTDVDNIADIITKVQANLIHDDSLYSEMQVKQSGDKTFSASRIVPSNAPIGEHIVEWRFFFQDQSDPLIEKETIEIIHDVKSEVTVSSKMMKEPVDSPLKYECLPNDIAALMRGTP